MSSFELLKRRKTRLCETQSEERKPYEKKGILDLSHKALKNHKEHSMEHSVIKTTSTQDLQNKTVIS